MKPSHRNVFLSLLKVEWYPEEKFEHALLKTEMNFFDSTTFEKLTRVPDTSTPNSISSPLLSREVVRIFIFSPNKLLNNKR
jgi:hypothetical protein